VAKRLAELAGINPDLKPNVFMKVGASSTVQSYNMSCFANNKADLADDEAALGSAMAFYLEGDAAGTTPFQRKSKAAKVGMSAGWATKGNPSPVEQEFDAILPSSAIVHYGANDMHQGSTYKSAIFKYADSLLTLVDLLIDNGVIPIVMNVSKRKDVLKTNEWIPTYNAVARGIAQARQVLYVDLYEALKDLPGWGLSGDGLHLNTYKVGGTALPCALTPEGLKYGFNVRNRVSLQAISAIYKSVVLAVPATQEADSLNGNGAPETPFDIKSLPFTDYRNTTQSPYKNLNEYTGCNADQDESGPEYLYRLTLDKQTRIRALVFDRGDVDVDLHLLDNTASEAGCIERDHQVIETTLQPGTYFLALDSFVSSSGVKSGDYLLVVLECHPDDAACSP